MNKMKIVRIVDNYVKEIIPEGATPINEQYPEWFCNQCMEVSDEVQQNWYYDGTSFKEKGPVVEPEIILRASDLANAIRSGVNSTL